MGSLQPVLPKILELFQLMHGMDPCKRKTGAHVEQESKGWERAVTLTFFVVRNLIPDLVKGLGSSVRETGRAGRGRGAIRKLARDTLLT